MEDDHPSLRYTNASDHRTPSRYSPGHVHAVLRPEAAAVLARAGPALPLHEQAPPRGAGAPALWRRRRRWLRPALGRDRRRQDDGLPLLPRADPEALQRRLYLQPQAHRDGAVEDDLRRVPRAGPGRRRAGADGQDLRRCAQRLPAADARGRPEQRPDHRRGADALGRGARAAAPAHQPRDQRAKAAADRPDRPARAAHDARAARARAAGAARDRALPPERALGERDRALHPPSPLGRRNDAGDPVRPQRVAAHPRDRARRAAADQPACAIASCSAPTRTASTRST